MALNRASKEELSASLKEKFSKASVAIFADYKGLSASDADQLRRKVRDHNAEVKVLKNNIARIAAKDGALGEGAKEVMDSLVGPTLVAFSYGDPAALAKVFKEFAKDHEALVLKDSLMGQEKVGEADVQALADLPSRDVMLAMLLGVMNGSARDFVGVLAGVPRAFLTVLSAYGDKKKEAGES